MLDEAGKRVSGFEPCVDAGVSEPFADLVEVIIDNDVESATCYPSLVTVKYDGEWYTTD